MYFRWSDAVKSTYKTRIQTAQYAVDAALSTQDSSTLHTLQKETQKLAGTASLFGDVGVDSASYDINQYFKHHPDSGFSEQLTSFTEKLRDALNQSQYRQE
ncbi:hypothetical protein EBR57_05330 [bacterium]|nr:hypothetical protein [bacterium]